MRIIGYNYEADTHCVICTQRRHVMQPFSSVGVNHFDEHHLPENAHDNEGNPIHPIFSTDEQLEPLYCGDCHERIEP